MKSDVTAPPLYMVSRYLTQHLFLRSFVSKGRDGADVSQNLFGDNLNSFDRKLGRENGMYQRFLFQ